MLRSVLAITLVAAFGSMGGSTFAQRQGPTVEIYKTATCGCCAKWVTHLEEHGFATRVTDVDDISAVKSSYNVPGRVHSCHTAVVDGYVVEGHVPAADVRRLLKERPAVAGIAVPGMPIGSPGMEVPNVAPQKYDVLAFDKQGQIRVFASH